MDSFNPTTKTQAALTSALQAASAAGNPEIRPAHLLMALLTQNDGIAAPLLEAVGVDPATIRTEAQRLLECMVSPEAQTVYANSNFENPVRPGTPTNPIVEGFGNLAPRDVSMSEVAARRTAVSRIVDEVGFDR